ncbi:hypothetical protein NSK_005914 [Nannochloropsis salina CCMP1776]|uniref:Purple acid phosphatase n=1 Tax=Nannochloropsis salina CCMP1776 TaxID=1027361 RepID=A0A4D9CTY1_9STRA|nr:hypothetical protein NSK_005914 [Nannochloropsis salina CCMP1776]|eukprot:TFJ82721.1 hypothetical protein NSK_005914 [Nannochloropsis salina CCMP1776]
MVISWLTPNYTAPAPASQVRYGLDPDNLDWLITNQDAFTYTIPAGYAKQNQKSPYPDYTSGWLHNVELRNLQPNTLYYYQCGDFSILPSNGDDYPYTPPTGRSGTLFFKTLPAVGKKLKEPLVFGMVADIGQNPDAQRSVLRLSQNDPALILIVGDDGYADCVGTLWDSFLNMLTGVSSFVPTMLVAGNHEVEWLSNATSLETQIFMSFEARFRMPQIAPGVITSAPYPPTLDANNKLCAPSKYQAGYEYGNSYFVYAAGPVTFLHLNPYSYTNTTSIQYRWLLSTLQGIDRKKTPWVVAVYHNPWYNSNTEKQNEFETIDMQATFEPLFYEYKVNLVMNGHVHAYERSYPVFQFVPTSDATAYVMAGTGADSVHDNTWLPQPIWSAYRNGSQWGTGSLTVKDDDTMTWQWHWNLDGILVSADEVTICNTHLGYPTYCYGYKYQCVARLRGINKAGWGTEAAQLMLNLTSEAAGTVASHMKIDRPNSKNNRTMLRNANGVLRVDFDVFGLTTEEEGSASAAAVETYLSSTNFVTAFGNGVTRASARCGKIKHGKIKF